MNNAHFYLTRDTKLELYGQPHGYLWHGQPFFVNGEWIAADGDPDSADDMPLAEIVCSWPVGKLSSMGIFIDAGECVPIELDGDLILAMWTGQPELVFAA